MCMPHMNVLAGAVLRRARPRGRRRVRCDECRRDRGMPLTLTLTLTLTLILVLNLTLTLTLTLTLP